MRGRQTVSGRAVRATVAVVTALVMTVASSPAGASSTPEGPVATERPVVTGVVAVGETLTASTGSWSGEPTSFTYTWYACEDAWSCERLSETDPTLTVEESTLGHRLKVVVRAVDAAERSGHRSSRLTIRVGRPVPVGPPTISGLVRQGEMLSATSGEWAAQDPSFEYVWRACLAGECTRVGTARQLRVSKDHVGHRLQVRVTARTSYGGSRQRAERTVPVVPGTRFIDVATGSNHSCGVRVDQSLVCWGDDARGQVSGTNGMGPETVGPVLDVEVAGMYTCAIKTDHSLACWGYNFNGQVSGAAAVGEVRQVSANALHACAVTALQAVVCWGMNNHGQVSGTNGVGPSTVGSVKRVAAGLWHTCVIKVDDTVACWGGDYGAVSGTDGVGPATVGQVKDLVAGNQHACVIKADDTLACWGAGEEGILSESRSVTGPLKSLDALENHACAVRADDTAVCWGRDVGEPGSGGVEVDYAALGPVRQLSVGSLHTCALRADETVVCWGSDHAGQTTHIP